MRLWTLIKLVAGALVLGIVVFTGLLVYHVHAKQVDMFTTLVPVQYDSKPVEKLPEADASLPDVDPGAKVFEKARELIAIGKLPEARERLITIVGTYPRSKSAPEARRIVGEMNMDRLLSAGNMEGKSIHIVRSGENFYGIAAHHKTTLDCIMHLNGLMDLSGLRPGEELIVMPLELKVLIEPARKALSIWDGNNFVKEYALVSMDLAGQKGGLKTEISAIMGMARNLRQTPGVKNYRGSQKIFELKKSSLRIRSVEPDDAGAADLSPGAGFHLSVEDAEELSLLLRQGNEVEIRQPAL